jgi:hypothetical protein
MEVIEATVIFQFEGNRRLISKYTFFKPIDENYMYTMRQLSK